MADIGKIQAHGEGGEAGDALRRVQDYPVKELVREKDLGAKFALYDLVPPVERIQSLFKLLSSSHVHFFPEQQQNVIRDQANSFFNFLEQCAAFDVEGAQPSPTEARQALIEKAVGLYQTHFNTLFPLISFATAQSQDFARLEQEARAASQSAKDEAKVILQELEGQRNSANTMLEEVRAAAAEQGVSKQAIHFKNEADLHKEAASQWRSYTVWTAVGLVAYAVASLFITEIPGLNPTDYYHAMQLVVSKILIFAVIAYMLFLCARNFLSHKHNEIINRHRQNALATFTALAEATSDAASSDIVLSHAAACIFSPQDTGLTKPDSAHSDGVPSFQIVPRIGNLGSLGHS